MSEVNTNELKRAVENQHGCTATVLQSVPVKKTFDDKTVWDGYRGVWTYPAVQVCE
jgi:hypothetical protein